MSEDWFMPLLYVSRNKNGYQSGTHNYNEKKVLNFFEERRIPLRHKFIVKRIYVAQDVVNALLCGMLGYSVLREIKNIQVIYREWKHI
jgi:hypothetical protein